MTGGNNDLILEVDSFDFLFPGRLARALPFASFLISSLKALFSFFKALLLLFCDLGLRLERTLHQLFIKEAVVVHFCTIEYLVVNFLIVNFRA